MEKIFTPTDEQRAVLEWMTHGVGNAVIDAKAGTGKSTLIEYCIRTILDRNPSEKIIYFAFNKNIVEEMRARFGNIGKNLTITTCHAFGLKLISENLGRVKEPNDYKYIAELENNIDDYCGDAYASMDENRKRRYLANVKKLLDYARYNKDQSPKEIKRTASKYALTLEANEAEVVVRLLRWGAGNTNIIDFTDMIWLPCENQMSAKSFYNFVFIDEAQDLSPIEQELVVKCVDGRRGRLITVGDRNQAINAWCGADRNAFDNYRKRRNTREFTLSTCQRCSKAVIWWAQRIVPNIIPRIDAEEGSVNDDVDCNSPKDGDMVVCRYILPLINYYEILIKQSKNAYILGRGSLDGVKDELLGPASDDLDKNMTGDGIIPTLYRHLIEMIDKEMNENGISQEDVLRTSKNIINKYDMIKTIEVLSSSDMKRRELIDKIDGMIGADGSRGIKMTTIHRAKGDEADNVYVLCPTLLHGPLIREDWEKIQEFNLEYVMITRARKTLNYMSEDCFNLNEDLSNAKKINEKLNAIRRKLGMEQKENG